MKYWTCSLVSVCPDLMIWCRSANTKHLRITRDKEEEHDDTDLPSA